MSNPARRPFNLKFLLTAALAGAFGDNLEPAFRRRTHGRFGPYMPHQGMREQARRRGGEDWARFKAVDRARRGLPA